MGCALSDKPFMSQPMSDLFMKLLAFNFSVAQDANTAQLAKAKSQATNPSFGDVEKKTKKNCN